MVKNRKTSREDILRYILIIVLVGVVMVAALLTLIFYIDRSVYEERKVTIKAQAETSAKLITNSISKYSDYVEIVRGIVEDGLHDGDNIHEYMDSMNEMMALESCRLILVDINATWYGENESMGRITAISEYQDNTPDKSVYMTIGVDVDVEGFVYRMRLEKPIMVETSNGTTEIRYCAIIYYINSMDEAMSVVFPFKGNRFIIDENGLMLYKRYDIGSLMGGINVFSKYLRVDFLHGEDGESQLLDIQNDLTTVGEFSLDQKNYYICTTPLGFNNWKMSFIVHDSELTGGDYIRTLTVVLSGICFVFAGSVIAAFILYLKARNNRYQLIVEQRANQYLEQASNAKTDFLSRMSHDIRTPINGIMGMTILAQREENSPKTVEYLKNIDSAAQHLLSLVNDVLDMSSIESGKLVILNNDTDLRKVCEDCVVIVNGQISGRSLDLVSSFPSLSKPLVKSDERKLKQIMMNLLSNAVKYTPDGGRIEFSMKEVSSSKDRMTVEFSVSDNGIGMKPEFIGHIFESFAQEEGGARTKYKGTGLGMPITKSLVEAMGGSISVQSEYEKGSCFTVTLPFEKSETEVEETGAVNSDMAEGKIDISGVRILLSEDNEINQMIAKELLEGEGATVVTASDGQQAVDLFMGSKENSFDIILMDIMMPFMNGLEATKIIRSLKRKDAETIPIIAMTANAMETDVEKSREAGMNAHLSKPIDLPVVLKTISQYVLKK